MSSDRHEHASVVSAQGKVTHVLIPKAEYDELTRRAAHGRASPPGGGPGEGAVQDAVRVLSDPSTRWHDAEGVLQDLVSRGLGAVRESRGLSQARLGTMLGLAQSQVSRYERNPGSVSVRVLKRIARALARPPARRASKTKRAPMAKRRRSAA